jgi:hypothetical protein
MERFAEHAPASVSTNLSAGRSILDLREDRFEFSGVNFGAGGRLREDALSSAAPA